MRNQVLLLITFILAFALFTNSCQHEPVVPVNPITDTVKCDSNTVYFENQVLPILLSSCAMSKCHDNVSHKEGVQLTSYSSLMSSDIVKAGKSYDSKIMEVITKTDKERMPPSPYSALDPSQIELIRKWIDQGAKNNKCNACDSSDFKFSTRISVIISTNCKGCHSGTNPSKGVRLENYNNVKAIANDGRLLGVIKGQGYTLMPPSGKMDDCKVNAITNWVNAGAPNN